MTFGTLLRLGNIYRILAVNIALVLVLLLISGASLWVYAIGFMGAVGCSFLSAWWIGRRFAPTIEQWQRVAMLASQEDFRAPLEPEVPFALQPLRQSLVEARRQLSEGLDRAREEKALLVSMLDAMTGGIVAVDAQGRILIVNRVALRLFGIPATEDPERFRGQMLVQLARDPRLNELVDRVLSSGRAMRDETEILATRRLVDLSVAPVTSNGQVRGAVAAIVDETTLKKLERVRQDFVTNVSHELKTPIAAIRGWSETLVSGLLVDEEEQLDAVATIYRQSERLSELVEDLLVLARVESTGAGVQTEEVSMEDLFEEIEEALDDVIRQRDIRLGFELGEGADSIRSNYRSLSYVLRNLIDNAVKYSPDGERVCIRTRRSNGDFVIEVQDAGAGIDQHHLQRIFERFYRVDAGRSRDVGGYGLGLSIVKNFVTALGGHVSVQSRPGEGSTFSVVLPMVEEDE